MEIVEKSSNNNHLENNSLQQEQNKELNMGDEDIEIEKLDEYNSNIKHKLLDSGTNVLLLLNNKSLESFKECPYSIIQYIKVSSEIYKIIDNKCIFNIYLMSCFLASLLFENKTTVYFKNHGISFKKCMEILGKKEDNILEKNGISFSDDIIMKSIFSYLTGTLKLNITKTTLLNNIIYSILDTNITQSYEIVNLIYKINPQIKIDDSPLSTIDKYIKNYEKELYLKKYNELFGNVSEDTFECIKYAYEIYCYLLKGPIEKLTSIRQELDKLSLMTSILEKSEIKTEEMNFVREKCRKYIINIEGTPTHKEKFSIKDLDEISSIYGKYIKNENGINLEAIDIFNNLMREFNINKAYDEYKNITEGCLKKKEKKKIQETLDKIYKYNFGDYIIMSYKIYKHLKGKLLSKEGNETNHNIRFAYSLFLGIYCPNYNLIQNYLVGNNITYKEVIKIFELSPSEIKDLEVMNFNNEEIDSDISNFWSKIYDTVFIIHEGNIIIGCNEDIKSIEEFFLRAENIIKTITDNFNFSWKDLTRYLNINKFSNIPVLPIDSNNTITLANYGNSLLPLVEEINKVAQDSIKIDINVEQVNAILCTLDFNKKRSFFRRLIREKVPSIDKQTIDSINNLLNEQITIFEKEASECNYLKKLIAVYIEKLEEHIRVIEEEIKKCENVSKRDRKSVSGQMMSDDAMAKKEQLKCKINDFNTGIVAMLDNYKKTSLAEKLAGIYMSRINICISTIIPSLYNNLLISNFLVKQQEVSTAINFIGDMLNGMVSLNNKGLIRSLDVISEDDSLGKLIPVIPEQLLLEIENNKLDEKNQSEPQKVIRRNF